MFSLTDLNIIDVCNEFGIKLDRNNKSHCIFHDEKTPSFTVTPEKNLFYCFGCGKGGDAVRLKALILEVPDGEILKSINRPTYRNKMRAIKACDKLREKRDKEYIQNGTYASMCEFYKKQQTIIHEKAPKNMDDVVNDKWCKAISEAQYCEYWFDWFESVKSEDGVVTFGDKKV